MSAQAERSGPAPGPIPLLPSVAWIIARMPALMAAGSAGQAWTVATNSWSVWASGAMRAPESAPLSGASPILCVFSRGVR